MEGKLWLAIFFFLVIWKDAGARIIFTSDNAVKGSLLVKQEVLKFANGILLTEEVQEVGFGENALKEDLINAEVKEDDDISDFVVLPSSSDLLLKETVLENGKGFFCNTCMEISRQAEQILSDPDLLEKAASYIKGICHQMPLNLSTQCEDFLETYLADIVSLLQNYLSQEQLCIKTQLCDSINTVVTYKSVVNDQSTCALCEQLFKDAVDYVSQNQTQAAVIEAFHRSCSKLGSFRSVCDSLVDYYSSLIFTGISSLDPKELCNRISFCDDSSLSFRNHNNCEFCESAILEIKTELQDPDTKIKLLQALLNGCKSLPSNYVKKCKTLVFEYGPLILTRVETFLDSNDICTELHICGQSELNSKSAHSFHRIKLPSSEYLHSSASM